ncbi:MAG: hypothetical protein D6809_02220 [Gammaproteobacteria bacterium]|nr:MAG: hypothetical protein D6809_02220 [Gammaproteobacteria bacterium]
MRKLLSALIAALWVAVPGVAPAAPGTLAQSPLFLSSAVEPNVMFLLDDSGSMEWETMVAGAPSGLPLLGGWTGNYYLFPAANNGLDQGYLPWHPYVAPSASADPAGWMARNADFNRLYYNPQVTYRPWPGRDAGGQPLYQDASPTSAPVDPLNPGAGTLDLTVPQQFVNYAPAQGGWFWDTIFPAEYYRWVDSNGNGQVDASDLHIRVRIDPSTPTYMGGPNRSDCAAAPVCTYAEEIQNFANWFTYYRKRAYAAKAAMGVVVDGSSAKRFGLWLYNGDLVADPVSVSTPAGKRAALQAIYGSPVQCTFASCPGTPARRALDRLGRHFQGTFAGASPILPAGSGGTCQQNFDVVMTDGFWNGPAPGVGNADGDGDTAFDGPPYADGYADTLADVAMHYYEHDLAGWLADQVPVVPGVDAATHQHLVTFGVAFGVTGTLDPAVDDPTSPGFSWPDPLPWGADAEKIDDLWHAAFNGRGRFLAAQDPQQLASTLLAYLADISARVGAAASVAFNSTSLGTNTDLYLALFNSDGWGGDLLAYPLDPATGDVAGASRWSAAAELDGRDLSADPRVVLSFDGSDGVPFRWGQLSNAQRDDLRTNPNGGLDPAAVGQARLDYLRGDRSQEGAGYGFRVRRSRLGDIVHSGPVYVGAPELGWPSTPPFPAGSPYSAFKAAHAGRQGVVYVGANDGMLHGFDAATGKELLAYVPASLFATGPGEGLHYLTDPAYQHRYYVDLTPTVSDVYIPAQPGGPAAWRTVLVGGLRAGGRGLFALDVTDPSQFSEAKAADLVLWEFDSGDDPDLGRTFSRPTIAMMPNGRWAAIFGNGYNDDPGGSGQAQLFILFLDGGLDGTWTPGVDYVKISTGVGSPANRNGLATPAVVDLDGDGVADRAYAGDLFGNLWAFDLSSASPNGWKLAFGGGLPLFSSGQPVTTQPVVVKHPSEPDAGNGPNVLVLFGTGQYLVPGDPADTSTQSFYGVWDRGRAGRTRSHLQAQALLPGFPADVRVPTDRPVDYAGASGPRQYGWYLDLPVAGERVVTDPVVRGDLVYFDTTIPDASPCTYGGDGWLMSLRIDTGGRPPQPAFDYNGDGQVDAGDLVTDGSIQAAAGGQHFTQGLPTSPAFLGNKQYTAGTKTTGGNSIDVRAVEALGGAGTGRLSWEELQP